MSANCDCNRSTAKLSPISGISFIQLNRVQLADKAWLGRVIEREDGRNSECNFTNMYIWDDTFQHYVAEYQGRLLIRLVHGGEPFYAFPYGTGDLTPAVAALREDAARHGISLKIKGITASNKQLLAESFPGQFTFAAERNNFDYIYLLEKMATLSGKKLHGKRNHIHRFEEGNDWSFEPLTPASLPECAGLMEQWAAGRKLEEVRDEALALRRVFTHYDELKLEGGLLRSGGRAIGFTIGERLNSDTYIVHFEKAIAEIQGAYPMVCREFSRFILEKYPDIQFLNREEDMGNENLRRAKKGHDPLELLEKFSASWN